MYQLVITANDSFPIIPSNTVELLKMSKATYNRQSFPAESMFLE